MLLHLAAFFGHLPLSRSLITMGSKVDLISATSSTPLHLAISAKQAAIVELLLNHKADPLLKDASGFNALHVAAATVGVESCVQHIYRAAGTQQRRGQLSAARDGNGLTPLHVACLAGNLEVLRLLCSIDAPSMHARTPPPAGTNAPSGFGSEGAVMLCLDCGDEVMALKMIRVLVNAQCSPFTPREPDGKTPATVAQERGLTEIVAYWLDQIGPLDTLEWTDADTDRLVEILIISSTWHSALCRLMASIAVDVASRLALHRLQHLLATPTSTRSPGCSTC